MLLSRFGQGIGFTSDSLDSEKPLQPAVALDVVSQSEAKCESIELSHELIVFKDPSLFLPLIRQAYADPETGLEALFREDPIITRRHRRISLMRLKPTVFRNFDYISRLYGMEDPRLKRDGNRPTKIIAVRICGEDPYADSLGFVVEEDLRRAQQPIRRYSAPPSVRSEKSELH